MNVGMKPQLILHVIPYGRQKSFGITGWPPLGIWESEVNQWKLRLPIFSLGKIIILWTFDQPPWHLTCLALLTDEYVILTWGVGSGVSSVFTCHCGFPCLFKSSWANEQTSPTPTTSTVNWRKKSTISWAFGRKAKIIMKGVTNGESSSSNKYIALYWKSFSSSVRTWGDKQSALNQYDRI